MLNAHRSLSSSLPRDVTLSAQMNSWKSIELLWSRSNVRKTCSANEVASPYGKKLPYIFLNSSIVSTPDGQSLWKPLYHCSISSTENSDSLLRSASSCGLRCLLPPFPIAGSGVRFPSRALQRERTSSRCSGFAKLKNFPKIQNKPG